MKKQSQFILFTFFMSIFMFLVLNVHSFDSKSVSSVEVFSLLSSLFFSINCYLYTTWLNLLFTKKGKGEKKVFIKLCLLLTCVCLIFYCIKIHVSIYNVIISYIFNVIFLFIYRKRVLPWQNKLLETTKNTMLDDVDVGALSEYEDVSLGVASNYGINNILALKQGIYDIVCNKIVSDNPSVLVQYQNCKIISIEKDDKNLFIEAVLRLNYIDGNKKKKYKRYQALVSAASSIKRKKVCPSCGSTLKTDGSDKCPYCKTNLVEINNALSLEKLKDLDRKKKLKNE